VSAHEHERAGPIVRGAIQQRHASRFHRAPLRTPGLEVAHQLHVVLDFVGPSTMMPTAAPGILFFAIIGRIAASTACWMRVRDGLCA